jgi:hypothetical protein
MQAPSLHSTGFLYLGNVSTGGLQLLSFTREL